MYSPLLQHERYVRIHSPSSSLAATRGMHSLSLAAKRYVFTLSRHTRDMHEANSVLFLSRPSYFCF